MSLKAWASEAHALFAGLGEAPEPELPIFQQPSARPAA
jgi:hypothetical protein